MTLSPTLSAILPKWKKKTEARRYRRVPIDLKARAIINGNDEHFGQIVNMSPGDLFMKAEGNFVIGDAAVIYIPKFDVFEGTIARVMPDGFALSFRVSRARRAQIAERLMLCVNDHLGVKREDRRASPRHKANGQRLACRLADGSSLFVKAVDMSADAVSVVASRKPLIGSDIHVGRLRGVVLRHTSRGFVVLYDHSETATPEKDDVTGGSDIGSDSSVSDRNPFQGRLRKSA